MGNENREELQQELEQADQQHGGGPQTDREKDERENFLTLYSEPPSGQSTEPMSQSTEPMETTTSGQQTMESAEPTETTTFGQQQSEDQ